MAQAIVRLRSLSKDYGNGKGAFDLNIDVHAGEVFGFIGPNGAGKSTAIRTMLDLLRPTGGAAHIFGKPPRNPAIRRHVGYVPGEMELPGNWTGRTLLADLARLRGGVDPQSIASLSKMLGANLDEKIRRLSKGNKQKIGIVQAFMHRPKLLILDEPTDGLDPLLRKQVQALIRRAASSGSAVFLSSHVLSEVEEVCDRVAVIRDGRIIAQDRLDALRARQARRIDVTLAAPFDPNRFRGVPGVLRATRDGRMLRIEVQGSAGPAFSVLRQAKVVDIDIERADLEEQVLSLYGVAP